MSVSTQTEKRLPTIKQGLFKGLNYDQIGKKCGVTRRTIERDIHTWLNTGDFETWLKEEWVHLHNVIIHENPTEAYRQITKILGRMVTRKIEAHSIEEIKELKVHIIKVDRKSLEDESAPRVAHARRTT